MTPAPGRRRRSTTASPFLRTAGALVVTCALVAALLAQTSDGWRQASPGRPLAFPADHSSHPEYKIEWWYYTGNVADAEGHRYGYQLTFFRVGVDPHPANPSRWAVRDLYMTHLAVTDIDGGEFHYADRLNRAGVGWAGADPETYRVWNEDWEARLDVPSGRHLLSAADAAFGLSFELDPGKPVVRHGRDGYSQKGSAPGNASHYYSLTRMPTRGTLSIAGRSIAVEGLSWMDHEFGTTFLESGQLGWDWFSLQFEDGTDLMVFQLRRDDGTIDPRSSGTWVDADGTASPIPPGAFTLTPGGTWTSSSTGGAYPTTWTIEFPERDLRLTTSAAIPDQELVTERSTGVAYWEGAVRFEGTRGGRPVSGRGYVELTGYAGQAMGRLLQ